MINILGTGLSGLVGSKLVSTFKDRYNFHNLDLTHPNDPVDITNPEQVRNAISVSNSEFVVHFAAFTDVSRAWEQKNSKEGLAYQVNVIGTKNIISACELFGKHLIHISTAYVFDGKNEGKYLESDHTSPIEWYGQTKALADEAVINSECPWTILRIDQPFRSDKFAKKDVVHRIIMGLNDGSLPPLFVDHYFGPTFIDDFVKIVEWVFRTKTTGLFHASSGEKWNDFDFGFMIKTKLNLSGEIVPGYLADYQKKLSRPYQSNTALNSDLIQSKLDFKLQSISRALELIEY